MEFKGEYIFNKTGVNHTVSMNCVYGGGLVTIKCLYISGEIEWEDLDISQCRAKHKITNGLLDLEKVQ